MTNSALRILPPSDYEPPVWDLTAHSFTSMYQYIFNSSSYGDDYACFGFPTSGEPAVACVPETTLAISSSCKYKDGAWEFLREFYLPQSQVAQAESTAMPQLQSNRPAFSQVMANELERADDYIDWGYRAPTIEDVKKIEYAINSVNVLRTNKDDILSIVSDCATVYFAGDKSLEDTVAEIQSRASVYMAEKYG